MLPCVIDIFYSRDSRFWFSCYGSLLFLTTLYVTETSSRRARRCYLKTKCCLAACIALIILYSQ
jgi:hypothetical protein